MSLSERKPERWQIIIAFLSIYLIWGSTYIAIRFAIESLPVFLMAGLRFLIAGLMLYTWARVRGAARPDLAHWGQATLIGTLLLVVGNCGIAFAEKTVPTGLVSLLVAMVPVFVAGLEWFRPNGVAPSKRVLAGLLTGIAGTVILIGPDRLAGGGGLDLLGVAYVLGGSLAWSIGSLHARTARLPDAPLLGTSMQMLAAGAIMGIFSLAHGEPFNVNLAQVSAQSLWALAYLVTFGSIIGFSAYVWLLKVVSPSRVSTYAYVNPVVAVFLGWALAGEAISGRTVVAAGVILAAVWIITGAKSRENSTQISCRVPDPEPETVTARSSDQLVGAGMKRAS